MERGYAPGAVAKDDLLTAIGALDDWLDTTGAGLINSAFPQPFRGQASPQKKALVLAYIALQRAGVL